MGVRLPNEPLAVTPWCDVTLLFVHWPLCSLRYKSHTQNLGILTVQLSFVRVHPYKERGNFSASEGTLGSCYYWPTGNLFKSFFCKCLFWFKSFYFFMSFFFFLLWPTECNYYGWGVICRKMRLTSGFRLKKISLPQQPLNNYRFFRAGWLSLAPTSNICVREKSLVYLRLASNLLCSQGWPWTPDHLLHLLIC